MPAGKQFQSTRSQDRDSGIKNTLPSTVVFQSTRSQDRDHRQSLLPQPYTHFNPLGRKTETNKRCHSFIEILISIHSVARPRLRAASEVLPPFHFNPLGRKTETSRLPDTSILSLFQSTRSQDRDIEGGKTMSTATISIHSVARPRLALIVAIVLLWKFQSTRSQDRDSTAVRVSELTRLFQSTRSQDRDNMRESSESASSISIHSVARPRLPAIHPNRADIIFQSTRSQDRDLFLFWYCIFRNISIHSVARPRR